MKFEIGSYVSVVYAIVNDTYFKVIGKIGKTYILKDKRGSKHQVEYQYLRKVPKLLGLLEVGE